MKKKNQESQQQLKVESYEFEPIKGYPMLNWKGKRPFTSTQYFPAQLKESYGKPGPDGWMNQIFWGDNLQVMSHLLKEFRGKVQLIYIDPPFDSRVDYKKKVRIRGQTVLTDNTSFEEKQYSDVWANDDYLQFIYDRVMLGRELLSETGVFVAHCDSGQGHRIQCILDEVFGPENFLNEIVWHYYNKMAPDSKCFPRAWDKLLVYTKRQGEHTFHKQSEKRDKPVKQLVRKFVDGRAINARDENGNVLYRETDQKRLDDVWRLSMLQPADKTENTGYPTQKPVTLVERLVLAFSNENDLVADFFMGAGTLPQAARKHNRRFIGSDINYGAIQTSVKRLSGNIEGVDPVCFSVFNVNNYDLFRNPLEAKELITSAFEITPVKNSIYDGEKDGRMVKIMPVNRIASKSDLNDLINGFDRKTFEKRLKENPNRPVEKILLVCMGHEPDLKAHLEKEVEYKLDIEIVDILRDKKNLQFKRESEAKIKVKKDKLLIEKFFPMNLLQKLSLQKEKITDWRELVESVLIDWNYDGAVLEPQVIDIPEKDELVKGEYEIPKDAGTIRVKITDLLSESIEVEVSRD